MVIMTKYKVGDRVSFTTTQGEFGYGIIINGYITMNPSGLSIQYGVHSGTKMYIIDETNEELQLPPNEDEGDDK